MDSNNNCHAVRVSTILAIWLSLCVSACSADLVVHNVNDPTVFNGIRAFSPANFKVTKKVNLSDCNSLTDRSEIVGSQLTLPNSGIRVIGENHGRNPIRDDPCLLQFFVVFPDMV